MKLFAGLIAGIIGAIIGAAIWGGLLYYANYQHPMFAWGVGLIVGGCVGMACRGKGGAAAGFIAIVLTILSITGGKAAVVGIRVADELEGESFTLTIDDMVAWRADGIAQTRESNGEQLNWPEGMDYESAIKPEDYPQDVLLEAQAWWDALSEQEKSYETQLAEVRVEERAETTAAIAFTTAFKAIFGWLDIIFFALAMISAYMLAARADDTPA